jgi:hypothetical protein
MHHGRHIGRRPGDAITAGITTAIVMVVAAASPHDAWQQPILRLAEQFVFGNALQIRRVGAR